MKNNEFPALSNKEYLVMQMLSENEEMFGLEMVNESGGDIKKGTIYVTLQRMTNKDILESWEEEAGENKNKAARRLYRPTEYGERVFKAQEIALKYLNMGGW